MTSETLNILLIEDNPGDAKLIETKLDTSDVSFSLNIEDSLANGVKRLEEQHYHLLLLDLGLPDSFGLEALEATHDVAPEIPIIILTGNIDREFALQAVRCGAQDYLVKGQFDGEGLGRALLYAIERKQMEVALRESELALTQERDLINAFLETAGALVTILDREGRIVRFNKACEEITGYSFEEVKNKRVQDLFIPDDEKEKTQSIFEDLISGKYPVRFQNHWRTRDDELCWISWSNTILRSNGSGVDYVIATGQDQTEQKKLEEQLHHAQKMEAIGRLASGVAHDFNNVLTVITGNSELLMTQFPAEGSAYKRMESIRKAADHAAGLTRKLVAFGRRQIVSPVVLNINTIVQGLEGLFQRLLGEDIEQHFSPGDLNENILIDPGQLEQVLMNLVVNAREAMPDGGMLTIETDLAEVDDSFRATHPDLIPGLYATIAVSDSGIGMARELIENIFEPFFTTKTTGSGLGLATVYGIVQQNGGTISVYSEEGVGTTFRVYLPLISRECKEDESDVDSSNPIKCAQGYEKVVIVEDDDIVRQLAMDMLVNLGYEVSGYGNAEEALPELTEGRFDLLLTDVIMPGASGVELVTSLQETNPAINVLYMSGYAESSIIHRGVLSGEVALIPKPFTLTQISEKVREVLDSRAI